MNETFENRLRDALREEMSVVDPRQSPPSVRRHPASRTRGRHTATLLAAAAAVAVVATAGAAVALGAHRDAPSSNAAEPQTAAAQNGLTVQGAQIFVPDDWTTVDASALEADITDPYRYCLLPSGVALNDTGCLDTGGILVKIAQVIPDQTVAGVQGAFQSNCGGVESNPTIPLLSEGLIGSAHAQVVTITCGSNDAASSTYWQTDDRTLTIQSPFNGTRGYDVAAQVALKSDLTHWTHTS